MIKLVVELDRNNVNVSIGDERHTISMEPAIFNSIVKQILNSAYSYNMIKEDAYKSADCHTPEDVN